jgi:hypothetical protein
VRGKDRDIKKQIERKREREEAIRKRRVREGRKEQIENKQTNETNRGILELEEKTKERERDV